MNLPVSSHRAAALADRISGMIVGSVLIVICASGCQTSSEVPDGETGSKEPASDEIVARLFSNVSVDWGVTFADLPQEPGEYRLSAVMGSGCAILDFDRDSLPDILLLASRSEGPNVALFRQKSPGSFVEVSDSMGLTQISATGVAVGDCNNDGWPDLYLTSELADQLWLNENGTAFRNATEQSGLLNPRWGTAACWLDYDRDGWLDLFVANYVDYSHRPCTRLGGGDADFCGPHLFPPTADVLFRNVSGDSVDGTVTFLDVSADTGLAYADSAGLGVTAKDFTGDGWIDIYVASDQRPNLLWINEQGSFVNEASIRGCDADFQGRSQASMGLALADADADGHEELLVSHLDGESHAVYKFDADRFCRDVCRETGFSSATRPYTGFGVAAADFLLDGSSSVLTVNGMVKRTGKQSADDFWSPYQQPLQLLVRSPDGPFIESNSYPGSFVARGLAIGDLDRDGDVDAVVSCIDDPAMVLRNDVKHSGNWLGLRLVDPRLGGRSCPGAELSVKTSHRVFDLTFQPCQSYASSHLDELIIGLAKDERIQSVDVVWPDGSMDVERYRVSVVNQTVNLSRGDGTVVN